MVANGGGSQTEVLSVMGTNVLIGGKTTTVTWQNCGYAHDPSDLSQMNPAVSSLNEATDADATTALNAICSAMKPESSNYSTPAIAEGACVQGHTDGMQSSNGFLAVDNIVVQIFGSTDPVQTVALEKSITPLVAAATSSSTGRGTTSSGTDRSSQVA